MKQRIWLITGTSSGLGKALAEAVLASGDIVIGGFRTAMQADVFTMNHEGNALGLCMDITKSDEIDKAFDTIEEKFGRIDVLVNNAGSGFAGAIEETSVDETRNVFEVNFYGALRITQKALPIFRKQKGGHIIQISSHSGFKAFQGFGIYSASKFALEGFSEALSLEVAPLGIRVTIVEPGPFRTNFAGAGFGVAEKVVDEYKATAGVFKQKIKSMDGKQEGDPAKAASAIISITKLDKPPLRLPLGRIAVASLRAKLDSVSRDLNDYKAIAENSVCD